VFQTLTSTAQDQDSGSQQNEDPETVEEANQALSQAIDTLESAGQALPQWFANLTTDQLIALGVAAGATVLIWMLRPLVTSALKGGEKVNDLAWRKIIGRTLEAVSPVFILLLALVAAQPFLGLPEPAAAVLGGIFDVALILQAALLIRRFLLAFIKRKATRGDAALNNAITLLTVIINVVVVVFALIMLLENAGIPITPLVAGLGVGGLAIGLAAQGVFSDLFAALSIIFDRPFEVGDFVRFDNYEGTVERIGLRSTHVRSLTGELLVVSNTNLLSTLVQNYQRMNERRIFFNVGVTYQTPADKAEAIPQMLKEAIEQQDQTRFDRAHFIEFGASSLDYQAVYYVTDRDFVLYRDTQQAINLAIYRRFADEGIEFAYPTQTLHVSDPDGQGVDPREFGSGRPVRGSGKDGSGGKPGESHGAHGDGGGLKGGRDSSAGGAPEET